MKIEKISPTKYRVRRMYQGKTYHVTYDTKPSKKQAESDLLELIESEKGYLNNNMSFDRATQKYVEMKENVLSPSTLRNYLVINKNLPEWFKLLNIDNISQIEINKLINEISLNHSPKTVRNYHGLISSVLGTFRPQFKIYTTLPQKRKNKPYIPTDEDIKKILDELRDTEYYIPVLLACYGLRRGEICALTLDDIDGDVIHVTKAVAITPDGSYKVKSTKTTDSERDIIIPMELANMIRDKGYIYSGHPNSILKALNRTQETLGIERFSLHKLRHYFASTMLTITDSKTVQALGGWKTDNVMKNIYAHSLKSENDKAKRKAIDLFKGKIM